MGANEAHDEDFFVKSQLKKWKPSGRESTAGIAEGRERRVKSIV